MKKYRKCPECRQPGVLTSGWFPGGTDCVHCNKFIEIDTAFSVLFNGFFATILILDSYYYDLGYISYVYIPAFLVTALATNFFYPRFMPLKHYPNSDLL